MFGQHCETLLLARARAHISTSYRTLLLARARAQVAMAKLKSKTTKRARNEKPCFWLKIATFRKLVQSHNKEAMRMVMKLSTHSFTFTSPAEVAGMRSGCSGERNPEVCRCEDVDGTIEKPAKRCSCKSALMLTLTRLAAARARSMTFTSSTGGNLQKQSDVSRRPKIP